MLNRKEKIHSNSNTKLNELVKVNFVGYYTIIRREIKRILRIWIQTILPPAITMTLYFIIFGSLIGSRIGDMSGIPYTTFIAPGLIMMSIITNSFGNVVSSFFSGKLHRHFEEMLVSPMDVITIVFGFSILVLSNFIPTIYFGVFTGIAMLLAMISVLSLLPSLLLVLKPFKIK